MLIFSKQSVVALCTIVVALFSGQIFANTPPTLDVQDQTVKVGKLIDIIVAPKDEDGVVPGVSILSGPAGATLEDNGDGTRQLRWLAEKIGEQQLVFSVSDGQKDDLRREYTMRISIVPDLVQANAQVLSTPTLQTKPKEEPLQLALPANPTLSTTQHNNAPTVDDSNLPQYLIDLKEPNIDTNLVRITDRSLFNFYSNSATHRYSKKQAWNSNETMVEVDHKILDANTYSVLHHSIPLTSERAWSSSDPSTMIGISYYNGKQTALAYHNFATDHTRTIATFPEYQSCTLGDGEGNPSNDDSRILVVCKGSSNSDINAISIALPSGDVIGRARLEPDYNWAGFSQTGKYVIVEYAVMGLGNFRLVKYSPDLREHSIFLDHDVGHGDFGIDNEGNDVYVMIDHTGLYYKRLNDNVAVHIGSLNDGSGLGFGHISCRNIKLTGWCFYSSTNNNSIGQFLLGIDGNKPNKQVNGKQWRTGIQQIEEWGESRSSSSRYDSQPKVSSSPTGSQLIYSSDWFGNSDVHSFVSKKINR